MSNIDKYAKFISDQVKQDNLFGPVYAGKEPTEEVVTEAKAKGTSELADLAARHAGMHYNSKDMMDAYGDSDLAEAHDSEHEKLEAHITKKYGSETLKNVQAHSKAMDKHVNHAMFTSVGIKRKQPDTSRLQEAQKKLGVAVEPKAALDHAVNMQEGHGYKFHGKD